jgi:hypothetical protein
MASRRDNRLILVDGPDDVMLAAFNLEDELAQKSLMIGLAEGLVALRELLGIKRDSWTPSGLALIRGPPRCGVCGPADANAKTPRNHEMIRCSVKPVRRVEIPKPDGGGVRKLGIPTVLDGFVQHRQRRQSPQFVRLDFRAAILASSTWLLSPSLKN